jgi:hypothetical protein
MRSGKLWGLALVAVLAVVLPATGCGGSDDDGLTKAEFIQQADAICKKAHDQFEKDFNKAFGGNPQPNQAELNKFALSTLVPGVQGEIDDVSALQPPSGDEAEVQAIIDAVQGGVDKIKADPGVLSPKVKFDPQKKGHQLAKEYGMKECAT